MSINTVRDDIEFRDETTNLQEIPTLIYEFIDTLIKIKNIEDVIKVCFAKRMTDIYVVTKKDNADLSEKIMQKFAQWEAYYKLFPELHIINKEEEFYIPDKAISI